MIPGSFHHPEGECIFTNDVLSLCLLVWKQILANIYEPQGLSYVNAQATFLSNELLPLVEKTVTDNKVPWPVLFIFY